MLPYKIIKHFDLKQELLLAICHVKSAAWPYNEERQLKWIEDNLIDTDLHVLLYSGNTLVSYLNLVNIQFNVNNQKTIGLGIGNVCSLEKNKGYGGELIKVVNQYLIGQNVAGLLFCNERLVSFYQKNNWIHLCKEKISFPSLNATPFETMYFNIDFPLEKVMYNDRFF